ncbi:hypothetical protein [Schinkia azotoformans]|uniref:hypothetical protein n=1 Tax=Schinkia azotoformans TaxID=1454 RepID=UPI002DBD013D|nr:hypothetical protein [Schinkia azotoformans]MEC1768294.1 hypothetical protein [Schinkia azotoformans]
MLDEREQKAIQLYYAGEMQVEDIAKECGWANRSSIYKLLKREEAQEYIDMLAKESVKEAVRTLKISTKELSKAIVEIGKGNITNTKHVYAQLQALNSILEKSGITSKTTIAIEDNKSNSDQDYNELLEMLEQKKEE